MRVQHQGFANALDACLSVWPFTYDVAGCSTFVDVGNESLVSLSIAVFMGTTRTWVMLRQVATRFRWLARHWCVECHTLASGMHRIIDVTNFTALPVSYADAMCLHSVCWPCEQRRMERDNFDAYPFVCTHCGGHHDDPEEHGLECIYGAGYISD